MIKNREEWAASTAARRARRRDIGERDRDGTREIAARAHKPTTTTASMQGKASIKSDTFVITIVPNVDSIMLGALFLSPPPPASSSSSTRGNKENEKNGKICCNLSLGSHESRCRAQATTSTCVCRRNSARKGKDKSCSAVECKLMYGATAVKAVQQQD